MFVFGKVLDQLIRELCIKINPIIDLSGVCHLDLEISFNSLTATLFLSTFVKRNVFYSENIQYVYNFYGTNLYVDVCRAAFRTQSNICNGASLGKSRKSFTEVALLGSKYASVISFTAEKIYRASLSFKYSQSQLEKFDLFVPRNNKKHVDLTKKV